MEESFAKKLGLVDWSSIIRDSGTLWADARQSKPPGARKRVLIPTTVGGIRYLLAMESTLGAALTLRGAEVHFLLCDHQLPGCFRVESADFPEPSIFDQPPATRQLCKDCYRLGEETFKPLGLPIHLVGSWLTPEERASSRALAESTPLADIPGFRYENVSIGEHAFAGALRYFARGDISQEPRGEHVVRQYFEGALLTYHALTRLVRKYGYDTAVFHHGIYVPMGIIGEVCRRERCRVVNWNPAYRKSSFIFSHDDTYHHTLSVEPVETWRDVAWNEELEQRIGHYLNSRRYGTKDWIWFHERPSEDFVAYATQRGIDLTKPCIGMLSNVIWDAQLHYPANVFASMVDWAVDTVRYFATRPDLQLIVRIHPAELRGTARSRQPLADEILRAVPNLPPNIFLIAPEENVSTYAAMEACDTVIIYGTKTGVELTSLGIPVIVAGEAWIRNKGLTQDPSSRPEYFQMLDRLPARQRMPVDQVHLARKYAFHFFMRRMIPIQLFQPHPKLKPFAAEITSLQQLLPGADAGLDLACSGVLDRGPFVFPAEFTPPEVDVETN